MWISGFERALVIGLFWPSNLFDISLECPGRRSQSEFFISRDLSHNGVHNDPHQHNNLPLASKTPLQLGTNYTAIIHLTAYFTKAFKRLKLTSFTLSSAKSNRSHYVVKLHNFIKY
jgi:hypothetical protein